MPRINRSVERSRTRAGWLFLLPWLIGLLSFFILPFISTVQYSFSQVSIEANKIGLQSEFLGFRNYVFLFFEDAAFIRKITESITSLLYSVPVVAVFSIVVSLLLNQEFRGRFVMRGIFFLPVIIAAGVVMKIINGDVFTQNTMNETNTFFQTGAIEEVLVRTGLPAKVIEVVTGVTGSVFDQTWKSGIQILLFISALQGISPTYYEAASVEGANAWDSFWKITFPLLSPTILLVIIYTIIDSFTDVTNPVMLNMMERFDNFYYGIASASAVVYFLAIMLILGAVFLVFSRSKLKKD